MTYCGYNQLNDPDDYAYTLRKDKEHQKLVNRYRAKDATGKYINTPITKEEKRKELLITIPLYIIGVPILFVLPFIIFFAMIGV